MHAQQKEQQVFHDVELSWEHERRKILVVDDEAMVRDVVVRMLDRLGFETFAAADAGAALDQLEREGCQLAGAFVDLVLPGVRGDHLTRAINSRCPNLPVVIMTGAELDTAGLRRSGLTVEAVLKKPFTFDELREALASAS
jgi:CheY-like chemotaxis protein